MVLGYFYIKRILRYVALAMKVVDFFLFYEVARQNKKAPLLLTTVCSIGASWVTKESPLAHIPSWHYADLVVCYYNGIIV